MKKLLKCKVCEFREFREQYTGPTDVLKKWEKSKIVATIHE